jgi:hypothetical protein
VHDVLKNELAAGALPCGRFGANAAWLRLAILTHNVLTALKRQALPVELLQARPKRLRFLFFNTAGRLMHHARRTILRPASNVTRPRKYLAMLQLLPLPAYNPLPTDLQSLSGANPAIRARNHPDDCSAGSTDSPQGTLLSTHIHADAKISIHPTSPYAHPSHKGSSLATTPTLTDGSGMSLPVLLSTTSSTLPLET